MAVKQSLNILSQMRIDVPHLRMLDQGVIKDFSLLLNSFTGGNPYILRGFTIPVSGISGSAENLQVVVDSSVVWIPNNVNGSFLKVDSGTPNEILNPATNTKVVGSFAPNTTNYLGVRFNRATDETTTDLVALWDVDSQTEFTRSLPIGIVMNYEFVITTTGFGDAAPIAIITTNPGGIVTSIKNAKASLFRLGSGGESPDINNEFNYTVANENSLIATSNSSPDPFAGGDFEIKSFKEWMNAVMSELKRIKGSAYWYSNGSTSVADLNLSDLFFDTASSIISGVGAFKHDDSTPGLLSWSSEMYLKSVLGPLYYKIQSGNVTLNDGQIAYIQLVRNQDFHPSNVFTFTNGSPTVNATLNVIGISAGDWIKFSSHDVTKWVKVQSVSGSIITLESNYLGATDTGKALRSQGTYSVSVASPTTIPVSSNVYWIAKRDDNGVPTAIIDTIFNNGLTRSSNYATVITTTPHGLQAGQTISISGTSDSSFDSVAEVDQVLSTTSFTYYNPGPNVTSGVAGNGSVATRAKVYLRAIGELVQGEEKQIDDNAWSNILKYIGSESETDTTPPYTILTNGLSPNQITRNDNLTEAISKNIGNVNDIYDILDRPSYDEVLEINTFTAASSILTLPNNSRLLGSPAQNYVVGKGTLEVYLNGQYLSLGKPNGWTEVGAPLSNSTQIIINQDLESGDYLTFRLDATGGPGSGATGAPDDNFVTLPTSVTPDNSDYILTYDVSASAYRKQTRSSFLSGIGGFLNINTYTSGHTANANTDDVLLLNASGGNISISLPDASTCAGKVFYAKKIDSTGNSTAILPFGVQTIDGSPSLSTTVQFESFTLVSDGANWWVL